MKLFNPPTSDLMKQIDVAIDRALTERRIVGTVVIVMKDGKLIYRRAAGDADREARKPMREDAIFRLASVSKPLVSAAALALMDRGKLRLDDPVTRWLPEFRPKLADSSTPTITIQHLLTHTAGLNYGFGESADGPYHRAGVSDGLDLSRLSLDEEIQRIGSAPLLFAPGTSWNYSLSIDVLGAIIAITWNKSLPETVADLVTNPLRLRDTGFRVTDPSRLTAAYVDGKPEPTRMTDGQVIPFGTGAGVIYAPSRALDPRQFPSGGAGMVGTAEEFARFLEALRQGGSSILKRSTVALAFRDQVATAMSKQNPQGPGWGFGFGGAILNDPAIAQTPQSAGTMQWGGAYGHSWFIDPKERLTVVAFTNTALEGMSGAYTTQIRDAVYRRLR